MANKHSAIVELFRQCEIVRLLDVSKMLGHDGRCPGSGRKRTVNTSENHKIIKRKVARDTDISDH